MSPDKLTNAKEHQKSMAQSVPLNKAHSHTHIHTSTHLPNTLWYKASRGSIQDCRCRPQCAHKSKIAEAACIAELLQIQCSEGILTARSHVFGKAALVGTLSMQACMRLWNYGALHTFCVQKLLSGPAPCNAWVTCTLQRPSLSAPNGTRADSILLNRMCKNG